MARDWETQFAAWSRPPTPSETDKMERAEREIRAAIGKSTKLSSRGVRVFSQGSYRNRTNVPGESDVDICVEAQEVFISDWDWVDERARTDDAVRADLERRANLYRLTDYDYTTYKAEVEEALVAYFGRAAVVRSDKVFDIHETGSRVESDCLAAWRYRLWRSVLTSEDGIAFFADSKPFTRITNFPDQQYANGVAKHAATRDRFKKIVRILKNLRNEMAEAGEKTAEPISSFLTESLVWNVPDARFGLPTFHEEVKVVLASIYTATKDDETSKDWLEENGIKLLFHWTQKWTRAEANAFALAAWGYVGFA